MSAAERIRHIGAELKGHAPFTIVGALLGIVFMLIFNKIGKPEASTLFKIFHPTHVVLSAMVTASLFRIHENKKNILLIIVIGYVGSIGVATLSDCIIPYIGEKLLGLDIPTHANMHVETEHTEPDAHAGHDHNAHADDGSGHTELAKEHDHGSHSEHGLHLGFIEDWYIVNPAAALGILIAFLLPRTKTPHALHVLISTWASSAHILMNSTGSLSIADMSGAFAVLFIAVWLPCCISDIVFPLLFVKSDLKLVNSCVCTNHTHHSHDHTHQHTEKCDGGEN
ncbi:MAG: hypothetical protein K9M75_00625 [Phycisphaerae bacterium]|nr:hypothetical protein [Phycisphaerae bacterium]